MEKALSEGPGAATGFLLSFFSFFACPPSLGVSRFVLLPVGNGVLGWTRSAEEQRGDGVGGSKTESAGRGHRREVGSPSRSPGKFKKSPAKC